jgi:hypothetical protein
MLRPSDFRYGILLICLTLILWIPRSRGPIDLRSDSGVYYVLGMSLAEGKGYRLLNEPDEVRAIQYPPLLPALVAIHGRALGTDNPYVVGSWLKFTYAIFSVLYALSVYALARMYLNPGYSALAALMTAFDVNTLCYEEILYAEIPFALVTVLFAVANRYHEDRLLSLPASLLGVAAYLIRSVGLGLLAAWVVESLLKRRWAQAAIRTGIALIPILAWQTYVGRVTSGEEYKHPAYAYQRAAYQFNNVGYIENIMFVDPFSPELGRLTPTGLVTRVTENLAAMPQQVGRLVLAHGSLRTWLSGREWRLAGLPLTPDGAVGLVLGLQGLLVLGGLGLSLARREWMIPLYVAASLLLISITPWAKGFQRYLTPLLPFLFLNLVWLLSWFAGLTLKLWPRPYRLFGPALAGLVIASILVNKAVSAKILIRARSAVYQGTGSGIHGGYKLMRYSRASYKLDEALDWLKRHAKAGEVVATEEPHWAYLKTGLKAVLPPMEIDPATAQRLLDSVPVDYLILDETNFLDVTRRYAEPLIEASPGRWALLYNVPESRTRIYRRL